MTIRFLLIFFALILIGRYGYSQVKSEKYLNGSVVTSITGYGDNIWIATYGEGIFRYSEKDGRWFNFSTQKSNIPGDFLYAIAVNKNYVWAGTAEGLYIYDKRRNAWRVRKFALGGIMGNWIRSLCYDSTKNVLWIGRFENLTMLDVSRQRFTDHALTIDNDVKTNNFKVIKLDGDSLVWFGTEAGVYKYKKHLSINDKDAWKFYSNKNGGFDDEGKAVSVSDILIDRSGIWFGTDEFITKQSPDFNLGGLYDFNRRHTWTRLSEKDGLPANGIYCLSMTGNKIWAGIYSFDGKEKKDYGKGLILIDRVTWDITHVDLNSIQIQSSKILSMYFDGSYMWLGTGDGVSRIRISNPLARWDGKKGMRRKR